MLHHGQIRRRADENYNEPLLCRSRTYSVHKAMPPSRVRHSPSPATYHLM